jgi:hypothetical protein
MRRANRLAACLLLLAGCDLPRRVVPIEESAPPLAPGIVQVSQPRSGPLPGAPALPVRSSLPNATPVVASSEPIEGLTRLDLAQLRNAGELAIEVNDDNVVPKLQNLFDGDVESLIKTESINPIVIVLKFEHPIDLRAVRVVLAGSPYDWVLELRPGERHLLSRVPERTWSTIELPEAIETEAVRIEALRLERDDYVHVNELELWAER